MSHSEWGGLPSYEEYLAVRAGSRRELSPHNYSRKNLDYTFTSLYTFINAYRRWTYKHITGCRKRPSITDVGVL